MMFDIQGGKYHYAGQDITLNYTPSANTPDIIRYGTTSGSVRINKHDGYY